MNVMLGTSSKDHQTRTGARVVLGEKQKEDGVSASRLLLIRILRRRLQVS